MLRLTKLLLGYGILCSFTSCVPLPHCEWIHPSAIGTISEKETGRPIGGALVGFEGQSKRIVSDKDGHYRLTPISKLTFFYPFGDPVFLSTVEVSADGFLKKYVEVVHSTGEVYSREAPVRILDVQLQSNERLDTQHLPN